MKKTTLLLILCCGLISMTDARAHGLNMTSANITLRQHNHLSLTLATSLTELFHQLEWQGKPPSIAHLVADEAKLAEFHRQLVQVFAEQLTISIDGQSLASRQTRAPSQAQLKQRLEEEIAEALLPPSPKTQEHTHGPAEHEDYQTLVISIDGFMPRAAKAEMLDVHFPPALGPVLTNYSEPRSQTLTPGADGSSLQIGLKH
ncbi:hypothetical protein [Shewanella sedimentimangrovi]|uniref:Uncharacterized protein n=1 Tax=Shewanella sedimentimangrovi TaxID=2814293 RepID=A0ABX7R636_9GAMM|nr:hypothetical protein [Shewanella sedimentimangrovi]QSX38256.1 hypothetical protein JYB85_05365 [Shewanella sedimentimangrovi]